MTLSTTDIRHLGSQHEASVGEISTAYFGYFEATSNLSGASGVRVKLGAMGAWTVANLVSAKYAKVSALSKYQPTSTAATDTELAKYQPLSTAATDAELAAAVAKYAPLSTAQTQAMMSSYQTTAGMSAYAPASTAQTQAMMSSYQTTAGMSAFAPASTAQTQAMMSAFAPVSTAQTQAMMSAYQPASTAATDAEIANFISSMVQDTTPQLGGNLDLNSKYIQATPTPGSDHTGAGGFRYLVTAGQNVSAMHGARVKPDGTWAMTDADFLSTGLGVGIFLSTVASNGTVGVLSPYPILRDDTWNWTVGAPVYHSTTTGDFTQTPPAGASDYVVVAGIPTHADRMLYTPGYCYIKHA